MERKVTQRAVLFGILAVVGLGSYICLEVGLHPTPGWTPLIKVQNEGADPLLEYYDGQLWLAYSISTEEGRRIEIVHSQNGIEWSPPMVLTAESSDNCTSPSQIQLLKRPDGSLWFFWKEFSRDDCTTEILYCSVLGDSHEWGNPRELYRVDKPSFYFSAITNAPEGGISILEHRKDGYTVRLLDETLTIKPPLSLSLPQHSLCKDILLDKTQTLWVVYSNEEGKAMTITSEDGISWSWPHSIPVRSFLSGELLQRKNGQFVFIFQSGNEIRITISHDGYTWSESTLAARVDREDDWIDDFDVTESDDGSLWAIIELKKVLSITKYSDEQFSEDINKMESIRLKNGTIAAFAAFAAGLFWLFIRRTPLYKYITSKLIDEDDGLNIGNIAKTFGLIAIILSVIGLTCYFFIGMSAALPLMILSVISASAGVLCHSMREIFT